MQTNNSIILDLLRKSGWADLDTLLEIQPYNEEVVTMDQQQAMITVQLIHYMIGKGVGDTEYMHLQDILDVCEQIVDGTLFVKYPNDPQDNYKIEWREPWI